MQLRRKTSVWGLVLGLTLTAGLASLSGFSAIADDGQDAEMRLAALESQAHMLSSALNGVESGLSGIAPVPPAEIGGTAQTPVLLAQSSRDVASLNVRLSQLEEQIRVLTGQVEGLQFQMTQLQTLLERMQEDNEYRFQALEGGTPVGKTEAAPQSGSVTLPGQVPPQQTLDLTAPDTGLAGTGAAADPVDDGYTPGAPEQALGTLTLEDLSGGFGNDVDISHDMGKLVTDADADAQYRAGYEAVIRGDYAFAEEQFRQFIGLFPDHPQAPDATNWLGEALIQRGDYEEAADILLTGYQSYPDTARAPDMLFKLGVALAGTGERDMACRTFVEVQRRYPDISPSFRARIAEESAKSQC